MTRMGKFLDLGGYMFRSNRVGSGGMRGIVWRVGIPSWSWSRRELWFRLRMIAHTRMLVGETSKSISRVSEVPFPV